MVLPSTSRWKESLRLKFLTIFLARISKFWKLRSIKQKNYQVPQKDWFEKISLKVKLKAFTFKKTARAWYFYERFYIKHFMIFFTLSNWIKTFKLFFKVKYKTYSFFSSQYPSTCIWSTLQWKCRRRPAAAKAGLHLHK